MRVYGSTSTPSIDSVSVHKHLANIDMTLLAEDWNERTFDSSRIHLQGVRDEQKECFFVLFCLFETALRSAYRLVAVRDVVGLCKSART